LLPQAKSEIPLENQLKVLALQRYLDAVKSLAEIEWSGGVVPFWKQNKKCGLDVTNRNNDLLILANVRRDVPIRHDFLVMPTVNRLQKRTLIENK
jgi:hypothetical protein